MFKENADYKDELVKLKADMEHYKTIENTLQNTLVVAQTTAEEVKSVAKQQAEQIISEAKLNAEKELKQFDVYKAKMESILISQLELLKDVNKD